MRWLIVSLLLSVLAFGCEKTGPNTEQPLPEGSGECSTNRECLKKRCPQADVDAYAQCVKDRNMSSKGSPEYTTCTDGKCIDVAESSMGDGEVEVTFPEATTEKIAKDSVEWLRMYIFPPVDIDGKDITCARLKEMVDKDPTVLMSPDLNRYFPPPDFDKPITTDVIRSGDSFDLPYVHTNLTVPAGDNRVFVVQGFCNPPVGRPELDTVAKWWSCKDKVTTNSGKESTKVSLELPVQNGDRCTK